MYLIMDRPARIWLAMWDWLDELLIAWQRMLDGCSGAAVMVTAVTVSVEGLEPHMLQV